MGGFFRARGECRGSVLVLARLTAAVSLAAVVTLLAGPTATAQSAGSDEVDSYVALGDSFTSGPLIPAPTGPPGCGRSTNNYPHLVADALEPAEFTDVSCGGATTDDMTTSQDVALGQQPPQFDALQAGTDLVTLGISGNDIGFSEILTTCVRMDFYRPFGNTCQEHYTAGGTDELAARVDDAASEVDAVIEGIHERSPDARVLVVGYPAILPEDEPGACYPEIPISRGDVGYLRSIEKQLNAMLATQARENDATYVGTYESSIGHDACQFPTQRWVEALAPASPAFPVHPNADGMENTAEQVLDTLGS